MNIVKLSEMNPKNIVIHPMIKNGSQYSQYPKYNYTPENQHDCVFLTDKIELCQKSGIPNLDRFKESDNDCLHITIRHNDNLPKTTELFNSLENVDNLFDEHINKKSNSDSNNFGIINVQSNDKTINKPLNNLRYDAIVKKIEDHGDDLNNNYIKRKVRKQIKVRIATQYVKGDTKFQPKKIMTRVFLPVDMNKPVNEIVFKSEPEKIETLTDLRKLVPSGSTIQMTVQMSKFWAMCNPHKDMKPCGFVLKCLQIFVYDNRKKNNSLFAFDKIPAGLGIKFQNDGNKYDGKKQSDYTNKKSYDSEPNTDYEIKKKVIKKSYNSDSDPDSDLDSDYEIKKKVIKKI